MKEQEFGGCSKDVLATSEFLTESELMHDYHKELIEEDKRQKKQSDDVLSEIKNIVSEDYFEAIKEFLSDSDNGIWGDLKIVTKPIGEWQDESDDGYWSILKGMFVDQSCGYSGDDYNGNLTIKITKSSYLQSSFSL